MFGIFYGIYNGIMAAANNIDKNYHSSVNRNDAIQRGDLTYYGSRGGLFLCENGRQVNKTIDRLTGHEIIRDLKNGKVYYDLTEEKIKKYRKELLEKGETVYTPIEKTERDMVAQQKRRVGMICGDAPCYIDIETGNVVREIWINGYIFYMDLTTGLIIREKGKVKFGNKDIPSRGFHSATDIIRIFNARQERLKNNPKFKWSGDEWTQEVFYLCSNTSAYITKEGKLCRKCLREKKPEEYEKALKDYEERKERYTEQAPSTKMAKDYLKLFDPQPLTWRISHEIIDE